MKKLAQFIDKSRYTARISAILFCGGLLSASSLLAGTPSTPVDSAKETKDEGTYSNWVNFTLGGLSIDGDKAQFKQANHTSSAVFGGIEDMHYEKTLGNKVQLAIDGHALFDNGDYKVKVELSKPDVGYVRVGYTLFRTWYDGNGGYLPTVSSNFPNGQFFPPANNQLALDRGDAWIEFGLRMPDLPEVTLRYDHEYRYGQKDSTAWGTAYLNPPSPIPGTGIPSSTQQRKAMPSFWNMNESRDIIALDVTKTLFGNTDVGLGMRYEYTKNTDSLNETNQTNQSHTSYTNSTEKTYLTQVNQLSSDLYNGHVSWVTRFNDNIWLTTAYSLTSINSNTGGSRISGTTGFSPVYNPLAPFSSNFYNLDGGSESKQHVINLNLMCVPIKDLTITPAVRIGLEDTDGVSFYNGTGSTAATTGTNYKAFSSNRFNEIEESLDIRYTGIDNILLYLRGDWDQRDGNIDQTNQILTGPSDNRFGKNGLRTIRQIADTAYSSGKYAAGFNWYPLMRLNLALQYYHKAEQNDYDWTKAQDIIANNRPSAGKNLGIINSQQINTDDVNFRITWRPCNFVSLVSRYDMQYVTMDNQGIGGTNDLGSADIHSHTLSDVQSAMITNNMFTESLTVTPLSNLYIQGNASYVKNETSTPAGGLTLSGGNSATQDYEHPSVLNFKNNYYQLSCDIGYAIDEKTNIRADYTYYRACDYQNNIAVGMPYGTGAIENTVSANISRKLTKQISVSLKYAYYIYSDQTSGYNNNYRANMIYSGMQFRF